MTETIIWQTQSICNVRYQPVNVVFYYKIMHIITFILHRLNSSLLSDLVQYMTNSFIKIDKKQQHENHTGHCKQLVTKIQWISGH